MQHRNPSIIIVKRIVFVREEEYGVIELKFTKINDNSIRCVISREEMNAQGIDIEELMGDHGKAEEFLRYILQQARYEVDFQTTGEALNVQLSVMKDGDISLMISDDQNAAIHAMLAQFKERLREFQQAIEQGKNTAARALPVDPAREVLSGSSDDEILDMEVWAEVESLDNCIHLAKALNKAEVPSRLLKYKDVYYLSMKLNESKKYLARSVFSIAEYAINVYSDGPGTYGLEEHASVIIRENALKELMNL